MNSYLGIDTSCYTTSVALLDERGRLAADLRRPLTVKPGGRGLAQSEMVFQHTRNLPELMEKMAALLGGKLPARLVIGVSTRPRTADDSYMPAFVTGESLARSLAATLAAPVFRLSHQENHILAGLRSAGLPQGSRFLAVHLSGGTTEIVEAELSAASITVRIIGESDDLHAGQFIDRVGVALGLPFPAGPHLERLAQEAHGRIDIPFTCRGAQVSFSGPESHVQRLIAKGHNAAQVAAGVEHCIAASVLTMITEAAARTGLKEVLFVGGVAANGYIRSYLKGELARRQIRLVVPDPAFSPDNATGSAFFAWLCSTQKTPSA